jgi:hypothetical protein
LTQYVAGVSYSVDKLQLKGRKNVVNRWIYFWAWFYGRYCDVVSRGVDCVWFPSEQKRGGPRTMKVISKEVTGLRLVIYLEQGEAETLMTLLYQTTSDLMLNHDQLLIANTLMAALRSNESNPTNQVHRHNPA